MEPGMLLPLEIGSHDRWSKSIPIVGATKYYGRQAMAWVDNDDAAEDEGEQNAAYIVHACNAYPKMIAAMKRSIDSAVGEWEYNGSVTVDCIHPLRQVLGEIGED